MTEKLHISWEEFHRDTRELCAKIKNSGNYDKIVAVSRGGLRLSICLLMTATSGAPPKAFSLPLPGLVRLMNIPLLSMTCLIAAIPAICCARFFRRRVLLPFTPSPPAGARLTSMPAKCLIPGSFFPGIEKLFRQSVFCLSKDFF